MEIPDLVRERLGDEEVRAGVALGDEDAVCLTPTRTLVYRGEGLLSDESVDVLPHDVERIDVSEGRRKTKLTMEYVDGTESVTVPGARGEKVLELVLEGVLRVAGVIDPDESLLGVYRFSELTLILTQARLVKHVGASLWDEDFEEFPFASVTGLSFEEGSVATQIVIAVDGRPQRIKAPNDEAPMLRQTLAEALCDFHDVDSIAALNELLGDDEDEDEGAETADAGDSGGLTLDEGIDPLVGGGEERESEPDASGTLRSGPMSEGSSGDDGSGADEAGADGGAGTGVGATDDATVADVADEDGGAASSADPAGSPAESGGASPAEVAAIGEQVETLTTVVKRQNKLLRKQQRTIQQLIEELRQGR